MAGNGWCSSFAAVESGLACSMRVPRVPVPRPPPGYRPCLPTRQGRAASSAAFVGRRRVTRRPLAFPEAGLGLVLREERCAACCRSCLRSLFVLCISPAQSMSRLVDASPPSIGSSTCALSSSVMHIFCTLPDEAKERGPPALRQATSRVLSASENVFRHRDWCAFVSGGGKKMSFAVMPDRMVRSEQCCLW